VDEFACWINVEETIAAISWRDNKLVNFVTNQFTTDTRVALEKQHGSHVKTDNVKPSVAADYTTNGW